MLHKILIALFINFLAATLAFGEAAKSPPQVIRETYIRDETRLNTLYLFGHNGQNGENKNGTPKIKTVLGLGYMRHFYSSFVIGGAMDFKGNGQISAGLDF